MKRLTSLVCLSLVLLLASGMAIAAEQTRDLSSYQKADGRYTNFEYGVPKASLNKSSADTVYLMGGPGLLSGKFQDATGTLPNDQGWTGVDLTQATTSAWKIDTFNMALLDPLFTPNHGFWCGDVFANACGAGYGNNYNEYLDWYGTVADNTNPTTVNVQGRLNYDNEPGYDYLYLTVSRQTGFDQVATWNGTNKVSGVFVPVDVNVTFSVGTADYVGPSNNQVHLRWRATSDGGWSDSDCLWDTDGHTQLDNVAVRFGGVLQGTVNTFEPATQVDWAIAFPVGVGDFSKVWPRLADVDPCNSNNTPQFAFIDDGIVVPGTGGTLGTTWTYGPGGYTHNLLGGLAGPDFHINNEVWSPVLTWPAGNYDGAQFLFDVYRHLPLNNGAFYVWHVRSSDDGGATFSGWEDRNFVYYSNAGDYLRTGDTVTDLLVPGRTHVQLAFGLYELGWIWGFVGTDGTPAPYLDNVMFKAFEFGGPGISSQGELRVAQDNFPEIGVLDYTNLGANSVRFDMAANISLQAHLRNDPGDSIWVDVVAVRTGSVLNGTPRMYYSLKRNPLFNPYRTSGLPDAGFVDGLLTYTGTGTLVPDRYNFDLPDTGFFFPGDMLHYYFYAEDDQSGNIGVTTWPANTAGFGVFPGDPGYVPMQYPATFVVRALPTMKSDTPGDTPKILWWNDFDIRGGENEWVPSFLALGYREGVDIDYYYTNGPSSGVGNGLGGRATAAQLAGYRTLLYTAGDLGSFTLSNGDFLNDAGNDIALLDAWLQQGGKNAYFTGDDLSFDLNRSGAAALSFRNTWFSVTYNANDLRPLINFQTAPRVRPVSGNAVGLTVEHVAYGGCPIFNDFDAVTATGTSVRVAEFLNPAGNPGAYPYAAAVYNRVDQYTADVIYQPYDFMYILTPDNAPPSTPPLPARTRWLNEILLFFGELGTSPTTDVPAPAQFAVRNYPNPFNPSTKIEYTMPQRGDLSIKVFNVRGELVKTLVNQVVEAGNGHVIWDGSNNAGQPVSSGVYFYQSDAFGKSIMNKMVLVK